MRRNKTFGIAALLAIAVFSILAVLFEPQHPASEEPFNSGDIAWMLTATALVLLMTPGLSFFYGGMVRAKNMISTLLQSFIALGVISIFWYVVGFSLAFGDSLGGIIGDPLTHVFFHNVGTASHPVIASGIPFILFAAFQLKFAIITPALITGSFAERVRFWSYVIFICLFSLLIYCPLAHMTWHPDGLLAQLGVLDFAGGTVVHISAGLAAIAGAKYLGKRDLNGSSGEDPVHIPYVILGTGLLWFGWFGFNSGSALAADEVSVTALWNTHLASAAAMITWIVADAARGKRPGALGACIGAVVGLVAITPAAGFVTAGPGLFIGVAAALVSNLAMHAMSRRSALDDTLDVFACHGLGGITGMILTAVFAVDGGWYTTGDSSLFLLHILVLAVLIPLILAASWLIYFITDKIAPLRVTSEQEQLGLDMSQHNELIKGFG
ncbi:MAG: ammonium transporter [Cryomorphaceae bacterium]|nr:ammonium transporter [Flavobacteriales bacterium]